MTLYLDTEFNGHTGRLISIALASSIDNSHFYEVLVIHSQRYIEPWVRENVLPVLNQKPEPVETVRARLHAFLHRHQGEPIIADWPGDFAHLMGLMCGPSYEQSYTVPLIMQLIISGPLNPEIPHNALSDAKALMKWHIENG